MRTEEFKLCKVLSEVSNIDVNVAAMQETHLICREDCQTLKKDYSVLSAFGNYHSAGVSQIVERNLEALSFLSLKMMQ